MQEKIILTDIDGCVLDWEFAFHQWMEHHGHTLDDKNVYSVATAYNLADSKA